MLTIITGLLGILVLRGIVNVPEAQARQPLECTVTNPGFKVWFDEPVTVQTSFGKPFDVSVQNDVSLRSAVPIGVCNVCGK